MAESSNIVILGSGNLATHLSKALKNGGHNILQVYSRDKSNAKVLADQLDCAFTSEISSLSAFADIYIFAVSDSAILPILKSRNWFGKLLVHTAGSVPLDVFKPFTNSYGVLYPFQTFTKSRAIDFRNIPLFIEASDDISLNKFENVALTISERVKIITSPQRAALHLAGVFVNNFTNHMFAIGAELLAKNDLSFDDIKPLMQETIAKAMELSPLEAQTGPAVRENREIIQKHLNMLTDQRDWQNIYFAVSESIIKTSAAAKKNNK